MMCIKIARFLQLPLTIWSPRVWKRLSFNTRRKQSKLIILCGLHLWIRSFLFTIRNGIYFMNQKMLKTMCSRFVLNLFTRKTYNRDEISSYLDRHLSLIKWIVDPLHSITYRLSSGIQLSDYILFCKNKYLVFIAQEYDMRFFVSHWR